MKTIYKITEEPFGYGVDLNTIKVGDKYILVERCDINTGDSIYRLRKDNGEGVPGNMNSQIKRYHGWRGTTGHVSVYALGLRRIERIDYIKIDPDDPYMGGIAKVKLSADLLPDEP